MKIFLNQKPTFCTVISEITQGSLSKDLEQQWMPIHLSNAVDKRKKQSIAARLCAAKAAQEVGGNLNELQASVDGTPLWPDGLKGSLSHTDSWALACVSMEKSCKGLGADIEQVMSEEKALELSSILALPSELSRKPEGISAGRWLTRIFSVKEAFYKAVHQHEKRFIDFLEVEVDLLAGTLSWAPGIEGIDYRAQISEWEHLDHVISVVYLEY